jgi:hypothetical protein
MDQGEPVEHSDHGDHHEPPQQKGQEVWTTQVVGMQQTVERCLYTFLTAWTPQQNGWIVTGIEQPSLRARSATSTPTDGIRALCSRTGSRNQLSADARQSLRLGADSG